MAAAFLVQNLADVSELAHPASFGNLCKPELAV